VDHLGIASMNLGYGGEAGGGIYHSIYDDYYWYSHFDDSDFVYGRALAQTAGTAVIRLADADVVPFDYNGMTETIGRYVDELEKLAKKKHDDAVERNRELDEGVFSATADPRKKSVPPPREQVPPYLNFAPLRNGLETLRLSAERYQQSFAKAQQDGNSLAKAATVNNRLMQTERAFLLPEGLPDRDWFKNQIYAPGFYTGYGVKTLPGVRESIEQKQWKQVEEQVARLGKVLENAGEAIQGAAASLDHALK